jgi:orotate phosphoribosyltransferase
LSKLRQEFIRFAIESGVLLFGEFTTKAGRKSPYFFNAGLFNRGNTLMRVAQFYAKTLMAAERERGFSFDMLFGPAYKGITLASATAAALAAASAGERNVPFSYNRKEAKDHGEGGLIVGAPLTGRVVIVDDVISAGTSVNESVRLIRGAGATPVAVLIALDRQERGGNAEVLTERSAVAEVEAQLNIPVISIASLSDIMAFLVQTNDPGLKQQSAAVHAYRERYGVKEGLA